MEELDKKIAEWCGYRLCDHWDNPRHDFRTCDQHPHFTTSLDACFEYIVPKLEKLGYEVKLWDFYDPSNERIFWFFHVTKDGIVGMSNIVGDETPALALCRAVENLIDGEKCET